MEHEIGILCFFGWLLFISEKWREIMGRILPHVRSVEVKQNNNFGDCHGRKSDLSRVFGAWLA